MFDLDQHIKEWRHQLLQRESVALTEVDELEGHLRDTVEELSLTVQPDEAFLLATRRVGSPMPSRWSSPRSTARGLGHGERNGCWLAIS